ncbi:DUF4199 domain-containing protein [Portibacter marinus]|uniref:DUF4199 domain-containing protein n=1 Tax=Portibacter marinus TaxID=2898660 RepID=UPI001F48B437|nr:DUF4199 domain-containing protein [Portibacter marinus]
MNRGVVNGLLFGGVAVAVGVVLYLIDKPLFLSPTLRLLLSLAIPISFMVKAGLEKRKELGGFANFSEIIQPTFLTLVVGVIIFSIFQFILMSSDVELLEVQKKIAVESLESMSGLINLSEENLADMKAMDVKEMQPTIKGLLMGLSKNFILGFIIAALISLIIKRKNPAGGQS